MAEGDIQQKKYELAYHIIPDLEEADVKVRTQELSDLITQGGGSVSASREPHKIHLSYPIKNKNYAYFGLVDFSALPEKIEKINAQMKLQNSILRYLLITKPDKKELRVLGQHRVRPRMVKTHEPTTAETGKKPAKEKTKEETAQLEQELEKVIEGL